MKVNAELMSQRVIQFAVIVRTSSYCGRSFLAGLCQICVPVMEDWKSEMLKSETRQQALGCLDNSLKDRLCWKVVVTSGWRLERFQYYCVQ